MPAAPGALALVAPVLGALALSGCGHQDPLSTPVAWWHDLSGGAIAADRPPPPGQDLPYPHIYSIPPKPVVPSASFRKTVETQLAQERDDQERLAARSPIVVESVPPPPAPPKPAPSNADPGGNDAAGAPSDSANATIPAADAPPAKPAPAAPAAPAQTAADGGPLPGAQLVIAGMPAEDANLPNVPNAPPLPATFEGIPAEPAPTKAPPLPAHVPFGFDGAAVYFAPQSAIVDVSQDITIKDVAGRRGKGVIEIEGHGQAVADSPAGQEAALALGLRRAQAVAKALEAQHVPESAIRISATAFGAGASLKVAS